jgi:hypothetical protein
MGSFQHIGLGNLLTRMAFLLGSAKVGSQGCCSKEAIFTAKVVVRKKQYLQAIVER